MGQISGLSINMHQENEIRNSGKKGLVLYKKFITYGLPVCSCRVSINTSDEIPNVKKGRSVLFYKFNVLNLEDTKKIDEKLKQEKISVLGTLFEKNIYNIALDIKTIMV